MENKDSLSWKILTFSFIVIIVNGVLIHFIERKSAIHLMITDDGWIQLATAFFLCLSTITAFVYFVQRKESMWRWAQFTFIMLIYSLREMDFHYMFTEESVTRYNFYLKPYPLYQKIIAGTILLIFAINGLHFILKGFKAFYEDLKSKQTWAIQLVLWGTILVSSQVLDRMRFSKTFTGCVIEESMELMASIIMLSVIFRFSKAKK